MRCPITDRTQHSSQITLVFPSFPAQERTKDFRGFKLQFKESNITSSFYTYKMNEQENNQKILANISSQTPSPEPRKYLLTGLGMASGSRRLGGSG